MHNPHHPETLSGPRLVWVGSFLLSFLGLSAGLGTAPANAAWSSDPSQNLTVADGTGEQILPKVAASPDGGCFISWYDGGSGYDVRLQKLTPSGDSLFGTDGVLVADRSFSSVQDYALDVDTAGNALLVFRDDRFGGTQITAASIAPNGGTNWGPNGIQLTNTTDFVAAPKIAGTSDGGAVVAWTQDVDTRVQKLGVTGSVEWASDVVLTPDIGSYSASDLHDAGTDAILSFIHQTGGFGSPRHILAQKIDADGNLVWNSDHVAVFDGGSIQFGNFPTFQPDGLGGGVFSWYDAASTQLQCSVQRILADGSEAFAHNGVVVSTVASRVRVSPNAAFDPTTGDIYAFWKEQTSSQAQSGVFGQRIDSGGNRLWTDNGVQVESISSDDVGSIVTWVLDSGAMVFWDRAPSFGQDRMYGARLTSDGVIDVGPFDIASTPSGKSRLQVDESGTGYAVLAWQDGRFDSGGIYAQNVWPDGTLGQDPASVPGTGDPNLPAGATSMVTAHPNPSSAGMTIYFRFDARSVGEGVSTFSPLTAEVFDTRGRKVIGGLLVGENGRCEWNGKDDSGRLVAPGVYFVRVPTLDVRATVHVVR